ADMLDRIPGMKEINGPPLSASVLNVRRVGSNTSTEVIAALSTEHWHIKLEPCLRVSRDAVLQHCQCTLRPTSQAVKIFLVFVASRKKTYTRARVTLCQFECDCCDSA